MSVFDLPRLNFTGRLRLNPGTANNEDYAQPGDGQATMPSSFGEFADQPMGLLESGPVEVRRFGMDDEAFIRWIQAPHTFDTPTGAPQSGEIFPAEWNYYGDMSSTAVDVSIRGVQTEPGRVHVERDDRVALTEAIGAELAFHGNITDINPEGSPPATQFFVDGLTLSTGGRSLISGGRTSKGVGTWINFYRNVARVADDGSGTFVQHVVTGADVDLPGFEHADGVVMRYYIYLPLLDDERTLKQPWLEQYYRDQRENPKTLDIVGTLAPYHAHEPIAMPPGRLLISRTQNIATGSLQNNGVGKGVALAPAIAHRCDDLLTVDFVGSFPEKWDAPGVNPKYDFGDVTLRVARGDDVAHVGTVAYTDVAAGDAAGWLFEFDLPAEARELLADDGARLELHHATAGVVLREVDYYVVSDQLAVYAEQGGPDDEFVSQGPAEPVSVSVYHRGERIDDAPPITVWRYRTVPIQDPGDAVEVTTALRSGEALTVPTDDASAYLLTFRVDGETNPPAAEFPPGDYSRFAYPPDAFVVTWAPSISVRVLPNEDYSEYYEEPTAAVPVANDALTWDVVYRNVLRTYALLYPAMNNKIPLADEAAVTEFAEYVAAAIAEENWASSRYMPPTRDLSRSRRQLLTAWCNKVSSRSD